MKPLAIGHVLHITHKHADGGQHGQNGPVCISEVACLFTLGGPCDYDKVCQNVYYHEVRWMGDQSNFLLPSSRGGGVLYKNDVMSAIASSSPLPLPLTLSHLIILSD